jgi:hypothetical protein
MPPSGTTPLQACHITSAAAKADAVEMRHFVNDIEYLISTIDIKRIAKLSFAIDDIPYYVTHKENTSDGESRICIQAILGYLPYSIDSSERRQAILTILDATHSLFHVRFGLDHNSRIFAAGNFTSDTLASPDFVFFPLICFLQEAQPYIHLIGQYL